MNNYRGHSLYNNFQNDRRAYSIGYRGYDQKTIGHRYAAQRYAQRLKYTKNNTYSDNQRYAENRGKSGKDYHRSHDNHHGKNKFN